MDTLILPDLRFAIRSLGRSPGFVLIAVITLGLGIGANTSTFSLANEIFLRPLPYPDSDQLDRIYRPTPQDSRGGVSPADYLDLKSETNGYGEIAAYAFSDMSLAEPGEPADMARGLRVSANLFSTLRIEPELGRTFRPDEQISGNHRVLMISHRFWQTRFGADAHIIGRTVRVNGEAHDIVGVLPATLNDWRHLGVFDLFRPLALTEQDTRDRSTTSLRLVARRSRNLPTHRGVLPRPADEQRSRLDRRHPPAHCSRPDRFLHAREIRLENRPHRNTAGRIGAGPLTFVGVTTC